MENPIELHLLAAKRIFRSLKETIEFGVFYKRGEKKCFSERLAVTTLEMEMTGKARLDMSSWSSKKQPIITLSITEAEFIAATSCAFQAIWLKRLIR